MCPVAGIPTGVLVAGQREGRHSRVPADVAPTTSGLRSHTRPIAQPPDRGSPTTDIGGPGSAWPCIAVSETSRTVHIVVEDLLRDVFTGLGAELPAPRRHALAVVLLLEELRAGPGDPAVVAASVVSAVRVLRADGSLVVAVNDAQWLDEPSRAASSRSQGRQGHVAGSTEPALRRAVQSA